MEMRPAPEPTETLTLEERRRRVAAIERRAAAIERRAATEREARAAELARESLEGPTARRPTPNPALDLYRARVHAMATRN